MSEPLSTPKLPTFSWIGHLKDDDRELLSSYGEFFPSYPGSVLIEEGVLQTDVFVVISGELEVYSNQEDGTRVLRARVGPGQTIGEISLFDPAPSTATVIATEFSQLWRIADEDLLQFMEEDPGAGNILLRTLTKILTQRLRQIDPAAFGLSAYAVVQSPELEAQDAATSQRIPNVTAALSSPAPASAIPLPAVEFPKPAPAESPAPASAAPGTITPPLPSRVVVAAQAPEEPSSRKKTQPFADPDELEPL